MRVEKGFLKAGKNSGFFFFSKRKGEEVVEK